MASEVCHVEIIRHSAVILFLFYWIWILFVSILFITSQLWDCTFPDLVASSLEVQWRCRIQGKHVVSQQTVASCSSEQDSSLTTDVVSPELDENCLHPNTYRFHRNILMSDGIASSKIPVRCEGTSWDSSHKLNIWAHEESRRSKVSIPTQTVFWRV